MNSKVEGKINLDVAKWTIALSVMLGGIYANSYYSSIEPFYRVLAGAALFLLCVLIVISTEKGGYAWNLAKEARIELRKVVWPNSQETGQTTLMVVGVVIFVGLILWVMDSLLSWGVSGTIG